MDVLNFCLFNHERKNGLSLKDEISALESEAEFLNDLASKPEELQAFLKSNGLRGSADLTLLDLQETIRGRILEYRVELSKSAISSYSGDTRGSFLSKVAESFSGLLRGVGRFAGLGLDMKSVNTISTLGNIMENTDPLYVADYRCGANRCSLNVYGLD